VRRADRGIDFVAVANGTRARTSCVAGLTMSRHSVVFDSTNSPLINSLTVTGWLPARVEGTALMISFHIRVASAHH
jgi:hypothetical protein